MSVKVWVRAVRYLCLYCMLFTPGWERSLHPFFNGAAVFHRKRLFVFRSKYLFVFVLDVSCFCMIWASLAAVLPRILLFRDVTLCCWVVPDIQSRKMFLDCLILNFDARCWTPLHPTTQHFEVKKILILKHSCCQCLQTDETFLGFVREERTN